VSHEPFAGSAHQCAALRTSCRVQAMDLSLSCPGTTTPQVNLLLLMAEWLQHGCISFVSFLCRCRTVVEVVRADQHACELQALIF